MNLCIKVVDGLVVDHPVLLENLQQVYPEISLDNLPEPYVKFQRIEQPHLGHYEKNLRHEYKLLEDGSVIDNWIVDQMSPEERQQKIEDFKQINKPPYPSWRFNEDIMLYEPPVKPPIDQILAELATNISTLRPELVWDENEQKWNIIYNNV